MSSKGTEHKNKRGEENGVQSLLRNAVPLLVMAALFFHPTQVTVRQLAERITGLLGVGASLAELIPSVHVTVTDGLFLVSFVLWAVLRWQQGRLRRSLSLLPLAIGGFFLCMGLSVLPFLKSTSTWASPPSMEVAGQLKQIVQWGLFLVCGYVVVADYLRSERWRNRLLTAFFAGAALALLVGLSEYIRLRPASPEAAGRGAIISALHVDATFGYEGEAAGPDERIGTRSNRNVLGSWLSLVIPLLWGIVLFGRRWELRFSALVLSVVGALLLLHGALWAITMAALLGLSLARGKSVFLITAAGMFLVFGVAFTFFPQEPGDILLDSVMLRKGTDRFRTLPLYSIDPELDESGRPAELSHPFQQKYIQWQPTLLALRRHPCFGVGVGNYQDNINRFYSDKRYGGTYGMHGAKAPADLMEKGGNAFYAVWMVETGFVGMIGLFWLYFAFFRRAVRGFGAEEMEALPAYVRGILCGAPAALGAGVLGGFFAEYWVRGVGMAFVFVLALCTLLGRNGEYSISNKE